MLRPLTLFAFLGFSLLYFTSYSSGPTAIGGDVTGSPLSRQQCRGCHSGGNFNPTMSISLLDQGASVTSYEAGKTYTLQVSMAAENNPAAYGFQAVVLDANQASAGEFGSPATNFRVASISTRQYVEHTNSQSSPTLEIEWTAPQAGTGEVSVYAAGNAVNGNSSTNGDNVVTESLVVSENGATSTSELKDNEGFSVYQSAKNALRLEIESELNFPIQYSIHDSSGKALAAATLESNEIDIDLGYSATEMLIVVVRDAAGRGGTKRVVVR